MSMTSLVSVMLITFRSIVPSQISNPEWGICLRSRLRALMRLYAAPYFPVKNYFVSFGGFLWFFPVVIGVFREIYRTYGVIAKQHPK